MDAALTTRDLWKTYGVDGETHHAVRGVDLTVRRGEYVALMGPSGSGKSTLLHLLGALGGMMDVRDAFNLTSASIRTHKLRSVLAAIGVVLGIGSVIGVVTMGAAFQATILGSFTDEFDADLMGIAPRRAHAPPCEGCAFGPALKDEALILPHVAEKGRCVLDARHGLHGFP